MEIKEIYKLWDRFDKSDVSELELEIDNAKLKLKRGGSKASNTLTTIVSSDEEQTDSKSAIKIAKETPVKQSDDHKEVTDSHVISIKAPLVGTYYCASSPEAEPFVTIGKKVKKGEVVAIVEAMKMMNEIVAPEDGVVAAIMAEDGNFVEYEEVLMTLEV